MSAVCPNHNMLCHFVADVIPFIGECYHGGHRKKVILKMLCMIQALYLIQVNVMPFYGIILLRHFLGFLLCHLYFFLDDVMVSSVILETLQFLA